MGSLRGNTHKHVRKDQSHGRRPSVPQLGIEPRDQLCRSRPAAWRQGQGRDEGNRTLSVRLMRPTHPKAHRDWLRTQESNLVSVAYEASPPSPAAPRSPWVESNHRLRFRRPNAVLQQGDEKWRPRQVSNLPLRLRSPGTVHRRGQGARLLGVEPRRSV